MPGLGVGVVARAAGRRRRSPRRGSPRACAPRPSSAARAAPHASGGERPSRRRYRVAAACSPPRSATTTAITSRRTGAPIASGWRKRSTRSSPPTIRQAPNAPTALEALGDARLQVEVALARPPGAQRLLERAGRVDARAPRGARARRAGARGAAPRGVVGVDAERRVAVARERRRRGAGARRTRPPTKPSSPREPRRPPRAAGRARQAVLGLDARRARRSSSGPIASPGRDDDPHARSRRARTRCEFVSPPVSHATASGRASGRPRTRRTRSSQRAHERELRGDLCGVGAVRRLPNGEMMIANTLRSICRCQP